MKNRNKRSWLFWIRVLLIGFGSIAILYFLLPLLFVRLSRVEWVQNAILGESQQILTDTNAQIQNSLLASQYALSVEREKELRSLWGSITVPITALVITLCFTAITYSHQKKMEREDERKIRKEWLERYLMAFAKDHVEISGNISDDCVKLQEEMLLGNEKTWGFVLPQAKELPADTTVCLESVATEFCIDQKSILRRYVNNKGQKMPDGNMRFALSSNDAAYCEIGFFVSSMNLGNCGKIIIDMSVERDGDEYEATVQYMLKKRSVEDKGKPRQEIYVSDMMCSTK